MELSGSLHCHRVRSRRLVLGLGRPKGDAALRPAAQDQVAGEGQGLPPP